MIPIVGSNPTSSVCFCRSKVGFEPTKNLGSINSGVEPELTLPHEVRRPPCGERAPAGRSCIPALPFLFFTDKRFLTLIFLFLSKLQKKIRYVCTGLCAGNPCFDQKEARTEPWFYSDYVVPVFVRGNIVGHLFEKSLAFPQLGHKITPGCEPVKTRGIGLPQAEQLFILMVMPELTFTPQTSFTL